MSQIASATRYRFATFDVDVTSGELRLQGMRVRLHAQPFQVLAMLLERSGDLVTREEIARALWPDGTFVDYDHGVNSAVNRLREALGDKAGNPRFIETLARRGYRFIAPVEVVSLASSTSQADSEQRSLETERAEPQPAADEGRALIAATGDRFTSRYLASEEELPQVSHRTVSSLFLLFQLMYLGFYVGALANLGEIEDLLHPVHRSSSLLMVLIVSAGVLIPARAYLICAVLFKAPGFTRKFLRIWPFTLIADVLWSLSPCLLLHHIPIGLAVACMAPLVYSPFVQRSLVLMGAGRGTGQ